MQSPRFSRPERAEAACSARTRRRRRRHDQQQQHPSVLYVKSSDIAASGRMRCRMTVGVGWTSLSAKLINLWSETQLWTRSRDFKRETVARAKSCWGEVAGALTSCRDGRNSPIWLKILIIFQIQFHRVRSDKNYIQSLTRHGHCIEISGKLWQIPSAQPIFLNAWQV